MVRLGYLVSPDKKRKRDYASEQVEGVVVDASLLPPQLVTVRESLNVIAQHLTIKLSDRRRKRPVGCKSR